jgi:hypothetical protein
MAMLFEVEYASGELAWAVGHVGSPLRVDIVPRGPEACYGDVLDVDHEVQPPRVRALLGGPRRPTHELELGPSAAAEREAWMDARELEGWLVRESPDEATRVWVVALHDGLDLARLICLAAAFRAKVRPEP